MKKKLKQIKKSQPKNKTFYAGIGLVLVGIMFGAVYFSGALQSKPAGQLYKPETGINTFLNSKPKTIFVDDTLSQSINAKINELATKYEVGDIKVLTSITQNISDAIILAKKDNPNLLVIEQKIGWEQNQGESLIRLDPEISVLYVIGDENDLKNSVDILKDATCEALRKNTVIASGPSCENLREHTFCSID